jgi:Zn-dependent protease with chaperone function
MSEYVSRLIGLSLAAFFVVHLALGTGAVLAARRVARAAGRMEPKFAARLLLALRWLPVTLALAAVAGICIPSYLWFEPGETGEEIGPLCLAAAALAMAIWAAALFRGARQVVRSRRCLRAFGAGRAPVMAVAGILRTRLLISPLVVETLDDEQLAAALAHERAHVQSRDNLKRLLLAFTPGLLPGINGFAGVERLWSRLAEWAADDRAVEGDPDRALALAGALVRVARLGSAPVPLASSMIEGGDLEMRVSRLLAPAAPVHFKLRRGVLALAVAMVASIAVLAARPATLESAHALLERLVQ